jgi:hypothetical protein
MWGILVFISSFPTRHTNTFRINRINVLIKQIVVFLIFCQTKISKRCMVDILLMSLFLCLEVENKGQKDIKYMTLRYIFE